MDDEDALIRSAALLFLEEQTRLHGEVLPSRLLKQGFEWRGRRVPFTAQQGIFKPAVLREIPLTIRTKASVDGEARPYDDALSLDGLLVYRYRGTDPQHHENRGLRLAMQRQTPLIYLFGVVPSEYLPVWPVFVVRDDQSDLAFTVAVDDRQAAAMSRVGDDPIVSDVRRSYVTRVTLQRVHQSTFRQRVLRAYREKCAICRLKHPELLDAAHILPDGDPRGEPIVSNGLSLCKLHHSAFDQNIVGVSPDLTVAIRPDVLREDDGPMLLHGLKEFHGATIHVPSAIPSRPNREFLDERFAAFSRSA